jgi:hypothetical protein
VVERRAFVEPVCSGIREPVNQPRDHTLGTEGRVPLAVGVEIDAKNATDQNVGEPHEAVMGDEDRRRMVRVAVTEPDLDVLMIIGDRKTGRDSGDVVSGDPYASVILPLPRMQVCDTEQRARPFDKVKEFGACPALPGRALLSVCSLGMSTALLPALPRIGRHARSSTAAT